MKNFRLKITYYHGSFGLGYYTNIDNYESDIDERLLGLVDSEAKQRILGAVEHLIESIELDTDLPSSLYGYAQSFGSDSVCVRAIDYGTTEKGALAGV